MSARIIPAIVVLAAMSVRSYGQAIRLPQIERRYDAVVLVADARTGRPLGGARLAEADDSRYMPGSLFKLAIAVAALGAGNFDAGFTYDCRGKDTIAGQERGCWLRAGHATTGFRDAVATSCNLYFRRVAASLTTQQIAQAARAIGMVPSMQDGPRALLNLSDENILGDAFTVSPSQMLTVAVSLATRGRISPGGISLFSSAYRPLYDGMRECVRTGTGRNAWSSRFSLGGKTGTSEIPGMPHGTVGWFIGFAPFDAPRYAIVVMQRNARGTEAAILARKTLEELL